MGCIPFALVTRKCRAGSDGCSLLEPGPPQQAETDAKKLRSSLPAVVVITSAAETKADWVRAGQVYERLALLHHCAGDQSASEISPSKLPSSPTAVPECPRAGQ